MIHILYVLYAINRVLGERANFTLKLVWCRPFRGSRDKYPLFDSVSDGGETNGMNLKSYQNDQPSVVDLNNVVSA